MVLLPYSLVIQKLREGICFYNFERDMMLFKSRAKIKVNLYCLHPVVLDEVFLKRSIGYVIQQDSYYYYIQIQ
jgi:hypothetical protein